jgi:hypothetical protein
MRRCNRANQIAHSLEKSPADQNLRRAESQFAISYQVTSPAPVCTLATLASMNSRSDRRFK